jgi:competence protein CoiA
MKFAVVGGERREAQPSLSAACPVCGNAMIAKCGQHRVWHWAHRGTRTCDHWWESETEWHRAWKNHFPKSWQEMICTSEHGEKHIADVKTERGVALEFQHSFLSRNERESREAYYKNMVWVVHGRRRARDRAQFFASLGAANVVNRKPLIVSVPSNEGALLRDWHASRVPVYFDFGASEPGDTLRFDKPVLWRLNPPSANGRAYLSGVPEAWFLRVHLTGLPFEEMHTKGVERAVAYHLMQQALRSRPLVGFERYMAGRQRARRRF